MTGRALADAVARAAELLTRDVLSTLGPAHRGVVAERAASLQEFWPEEADEALDASLVEYRLAEEVQEHFHDLYIDTTWPACPRHPNHPLWCEDGAWWCARDRLAIARLGALPPRQAAG